MKSPANPIQKRFFDIGKNQYDVRLLNHPEPHVIEELKIFSNKLKKSKNIIDFGSGNGRLTIPLLQLNKNVTAIDISENSLIKLWENAKKFGKTKNLKLSQDIRKIKNASCIVGADILHHIDQEIFLPVIYKSLLKRGKILFSEPNFWHFFWLIHIAIKTDWEIEKGITQNAYFKLMKLLKKCGFKKIKIHGFGLLPPPFFNSIPFFARINYFLGNVPVFKYFAFRFIIEAEK